jgi:uncharacterized protein (TIGR02996 family)
MSDLPAEEAALLAAIHEAPEDDAPRLVYADWLEDHGESDRADFIRAQVELARLDEADPRHPALLARARRSGMLTAPRCRPWVDHAEVEGLCAGPHLANLRRLSIREESALRLLRGPLAERLLRLDVGCYRSETVVRAVTAQPLPQLRTLTIISQSNLPDLGPLFQTAHLPNLCTLVLRWRGEVSPQALKQLARAKGLPQLSLVGAGRGGCRWWVLGGGKAHPLAREVYPLDEDWWGADPTEDW